MFLTPCLYASLILILPTLFSLLMRHSFQTIFPFGWGRFLWLNFCTFGLWSNSYNLCRTIHALNVISSCVLCILHFFICIVSILILLLCFCFRVCKNPKPHKKWKIQKIWSYIFEHISHVSLALYLCTNGLLCIYEFNLFFMHLYLCGKNLDIYAWLL